MNLSLRTQAKQCMGHPDLARINSFQILPLRFEKVYLSTMTKLLEHAVDSVRALPPEVQDELARLPQVAGKGSRLSS